MKIEHFALNVSEPVAMAAWYRDHLGMTIVHEMKEPPYMHFLADESGMVMIEVYRDPPDQVPDYAAMNPFVLHLALVSEDPAAEKAALLAAGATPVEDIHKDDGTILVMLRDPWGLTLQLCKRRTPLLN
jgi:catechol 2,3-dioxygenase-like lactoylglutathione lyase family enzyme